LNKPLLQSKTVWSAIVFGILAIARQLWPAYDALFTTLEHVAAACGLVALRMATK
jgi:hypothetical protein